MIDEKDQEFEGVIKILKGLHHLKAPDNFETDLMRRINAGNYKEEKTESWFSRFFAPKRFIPSAALAIVAVLILFVIKPGSNTIENPFNTKPRLREDMITTASQITEEKKVDMELQKMIDSNQDYSSLIQKKEVAKNEEKGKNDYDIKDFQSDRAGSSYASQNYEAVSSPGVSNYYIIDKSGLNFRQVNLTKTERMEISRLKANLMQFMKENKLK
ncbi:MAG: hypothetical protein WCE54_10240 [Ignavibacteriaceae bacterium]